MNGTVSLILGKNYTNETADQFGALKGSNCQVKSISKSNGRNTVTFLWKNDNDEERESTMIVLDGTPIYVWTSGDSYTYGDLVIYASCFYRCITPNSDTVFDDTKWNEIGSPDGNYDIVQNSTLLPSIFTSADRKMYYSIEDGFFYLWDGTAWVAQIDSTPTENSTKPITSGGVYASQHVMTSVINSNTARIVGLESGQNVLTSAIRTKQDILTPANAGEGININNTQGIPKINSTARELTATEYNNLSQEEKMNGTVYYVKDGAVGDVHGLLLDWSTTPAKTGTKSLDGKDIWQVCFSVDSPTLPSDNWVRFNMNSFNVDKIIEFTGYTDVTSIYGRSNQVFPRICTDNNAFSIGTEIVNNDYQDTTVGVQYGTAYTNVHSLIVKVLYTVND